MNDICVICCKKVVRSSRSWGVISIPPSARLFKVRFLDAVHGRINPAFIAVTVKINPTITRSFYVVGAHR